MLKFQLRNSSFLYFTLLFICISMSFAEQDNISPASDIGKKLNVRDFGAKGDGKSDDTNAFQTALNEAGKGEIGGTVYAPQGVYYIAGNLSVPSFVTLEGIWQIPTAWTQYKGTTLLAVSGEGNPDAAPFITLWNNSTIKGVTIFYPNQIIANPPKAYPWTIASGGGDNSSIIDVLIVNPYQAVDFGTKPAGRHYIRNLYAQPMYKGLFIDQCYDIGRVENIHFWPFWTCNNKDMKPIEDFIFTNGEALIFGRTDWEYVYNVFTFGYKIGYHFIRTKSGVANGNFLGIGADAAAKAVVVDDCFPYGLLITNGEFVSFNGDDTAYVEIKNTNTGIIQFQNCAFWGAPSRIANIDGTGSVTFNGCNFVFWDFEKSNLPGIECSGGSLIVNACNFNRPGRHIKLNPNVENAVIASNRFAGKMQIENESKGDVQIGLNSDVKKEAIESGAIIIDDSDKAPQFRVEGDWYGGVGGKDYKGITRWTYKGDGKRKAFWTPEIKKAGKYEVYIMYGGDPINNHATDAPVTIKHKKGEDEIKIDLTKNFGQWNLLGVFQFAKGASGYVMISDKANNNVVADAVKFVPVK